MKRVLLLLPTTGYRNDDFLAAAGVFLGRDFRCSTGHGLDVALPCVFQNPLVPRDDDRVFQARGRHEKAVRRVGVE